eukprot:s113_g12.t1
MSAAPTSRCSRAAPWLRGFIGMAVLLVSATSVASVGTSTCQRPGSCVTGEQEAFLQLKSSSSSSSSTTATTTDELTRTTTDESTTPGTPDACALVNIGPDFKVCDSTGWRIDADKFNDARRCDCPECEDEEDNAELNLTVLNCSVCRCPDPSLRCDQQIYPCVLDSGESDINPACEVAQRKNPAWLNANLRACRTRGWKVPEDFFEDTECDCPDCEDENQTVLAVELCGLKGKQEGVDEKSSEGEDSKKS